MAGPYYIVFAGVNGAGKSTLYRTGLWQHGSIASDLPRVNSDEILVEQGWDWHDEAAQLRAGRIAVKRIKDFLRNRKSFNQETTLSGRTIMRNIRQARELGFHIVVFYVGLEDPDVANARIAHRGTVGGHLVDPETVKRRYESSLANLISILDECDEAYLYDNTVLLRLAARFEFKELAYLDPSKPAGSWVWDVLNALGSIEVSL